MVKCNLDEHLIFAGKTKKIGFASQSSILTGHYDRTLTLDEN